MKNCLFGAIAGDISGSAYEMQYCRTKDLQEVKLIRTGNTFTDDTVCTMGVADAIIKYHHPTVEQFRDCIQEWCQKYPNRDYGGMFKDWINSPVPYNSYGNGSAMRVSPIGFYAQSESECLRLAKASAECSHNHSEGIKGAQAIALCIYYALNSTDPKKVITEILNGLYPEYTDKILSDIRPSYRFSATCKGTVPIAILAFLESDSYEEAIKLSISMGGDSDTIAAMAGGIAYAFYKKIDPSLEDQVITCLPEDMLSLSRKFDQKRNEYLSFTYC